MPILGAFLASVFGALFGGLTKDVARKGATMAAALVSFAAAATTLLAVMRSTVQPLMQAMFTTGYGQVIGLAFPPVAGTCLTAIASCWVACAVYRMHVRIVQATASA